MLSQSITFLSTAEGRAFLRQLETYIVPRAMTEARRSGAGNGWVCADDVMNTIVIELTSDGGRIARYAAAALDEPWKYLATCVSGWIRQQLGSRSLSLDILHEIPDRSVGQANDDQLTPLERVADLTFLALAPHTPVSLREVMRQLVNWLAKNPPQRLSYEQYDRGAAVAKFPQLSALQVTAVMNIAWGGRPHRQHTSLMAAFLLNSEFRPSDSPTHARAMLRYKQSMERSRSLLTLLDEHFDQAA